MRHQRLLEYPSDDASIEQVLTQVCGVQAQDLPAGELSAGVRASSLTAAQVEAARLQPHTILRIWSMRGTLHLMTAQDACWLNPFLGPRTNSADQRRMRELGWDEERVSRATRRVLEQVDRQGGITRPELARLLEAGHLPHQGQAPIHLLARLVNCGYLCQGPDRGKQPVYVPFEQWAGPLQPLPEQAALRELARRYLAAYAPAAPPDLAAWSGLKIGEARQAWELLRDELAPLETDEGQLWLLKSQLGELEEIAQAESASNTEPSPVVHLLPRFDTYLLGYRDRRRILAPELEIKLKSSGGILPATLLVDGRLAGVWKSKVSDKQLEINVQPFEPLPERLLPLLEGEARRVGRFLGLEAELQIDFRSLGDSQTPDA
jgi:hypothetical protein